MSSQLQAHFVVPLQAPATTSAFTTREELRSTDSSMHVVRKVMKAKESRLDRCRQRDQLVGLPTRRPCSRVHSTHHHERSPTLCRSKKAPPLPTMSWQRGHPPFRLKAHVSAGGAIYFHPSRISISLACRMCGPTTCPRLRPALPRHLSRL